MSARQTVDLRIGDVLDANARDFPERIAFEYEGFELSYAQLQRCVDLCAARYWSLGLRRGDSVAMLSTTRPEAFIAFFAAARLGLLWLGLNPKYQRRELAYVLADARAQLLLAIPSLDGRDYTADVEAMLPDCPALRETVWMHGADQPRSGFYAWIEEAGAEALAASRQARSLVEGSDPALLVYTSGSSGQPKGVLLPQDSMVQRSRNQAARFPTRVPPVLINPLPINHIGGMHFVGLYLLVAGGCVRCAQKFSPAQIVQALQERSITVLYMLPTMLKMVVEEPGFDPALLRPLEWFVYSGAAMSTELVDMLKTAGCGVGLTYGMTETCGSVTYSDPDASVEVLTNTIGKPFPPGEVRIADEAGVPCAVDEVGEMQVRAEFCMGGYFGRTDATREAYTPDGWMRTGDSAAVRADGNIRFVGRRSEMFKSGGYNVYPKEVELVLERHPEVRLAAVVGVPDPLFDEVGWAYVVPAAPGVLTEDALRQWCRADLAGYKVPKRFVLCDTLPLLPVGKVDKVRMRQAATAEALALQTQQAG